MIYEVVSFIFLRCANEDPPLIMFSYISCVFVSLILEKDPSKIKDAKSPALGL
jgi:hypothetical protein